MAASTTPMVGSSLAFVGHDPGALNHIRPILNDDNLQRAIDERNVHVVWKPIRPAASQPPWQPEHAAQVVAQILADAKGDVRAAVLGISTNGAELDVCAELKARCPGIKVALMVDFFVGHRMDRARVDAFPDVIMTTNELARDEVAQKWQHAISSDCVVNVGSTYLESLAIDATPPALDSAEVMARLSSLGVRKGDVAVPFFVSPDDMVPGATDAIASCLAEFAKGVSTANAALGDGVSIRVLLRPHPRNEPATRDMLMQLARDAESCFAFDGDGDVDNRSLSKALPCSVSMGSTLGVECMAWGCAASFFRVGWDTTRIDSIMSSLPVRRLASVHELKEWLVEHISRSRTEDAPSGGAPSVVEGGGADSSAKFDVECAAGSIGRACSCVRAHCSLE